MSSKRPPTTPQTDESIEITPRPDAQVCVAHGCSRSEDLAAVIHPHRGQRVLCPDHANDYIGVKVR